MINYQAVVRDASGNVVNGTLNGPVGIQLTILKGSSTGTEAYKETLILHQYIRVSQLENWYWNSGFRNI